MNREIRILSIDDEADIRYALKAVFDHERWSSFLAKDVPEGLALFKQHRPDLVLIDYHLPQINGLEGVRMLRKLSPDVPILVFTVEESQAVADEFLEAGATDFALKPIKAPDLISRIWLHIRLIESAGKAAHGHPGVKGIMRATLNLITGYMRETGGYLTVNQIAKGTGLAYPTTNRYLQYLLSEQRIDMAMDYGKVGRPRQRYQLK